MNYLVKIETKKGSSSQDTAPGGSGTNTGVAGSSTTGTQSTGGIGK